MDVAEMHHRVDSLEPRPIRATVWVHEVDDLDAADPITFPIGRPRIQQRQLKPPPQRRQQLSRDISRGAADQDLANRHAIDLPLVATNRSSRPQPLLFW
jgi:hypothetical protein